MTESIKDQIERSWEMWKSRRVEARSWEMWKSRRLAAQREAAQDTERLRGIVERLTESLREVRQAVDEIRHEVRMLEEQLPKQADSAERAAREGDDDA